MKRKILALMLIFIASCAPKIKDFDLYQRQFISKSNFLPNGKQLEGRAPKIVIFNFDENDIKTAQQAKLGAAIAANISSIITKNSLGKIVDRKIAKKLKKEIQLAEMRDTGTYKGPQIADFAVSGVISDASFNKKYQNASFYYDAGNKRFISLPARFQYKGQVRGNVKIYQLPSMNVLDNIEFEGQKTRSENVTQDGGLSIGALSIGGKKSKGVDRDDGLVRGAAFNGISSIEENLKNTLAQRGYILEKRVLDKKSIFKISLGSKNGIKNGDKFKIIGQYEVENPITLKTEIESRVIAKGKISNIINPKTAWVILDEEKSAKKIRIGDAVKLQYKKGKFAQFLQKINKFIQ